MFAAAGLSEPVVSMASERVTLHHKFLARACARLAAESAELRIPRRAAAPPPPDSDDDLYDEAFEALGPPPPPHPSEASLAAAFAALAAPAPAPDDGYDASLGAMF